MLGDHRAVPESVLLRGRLNILFFQDVVLLEVLIVILVGNHILYQDF